MDAELKKIYYDPANPGSFSGVRDLTKASNRKDVKEWLSAQDAYSLHKPVRRKFKRRKMNCVGLDHLFQCDLLDMNALSAHNDGFKYILTCIDCFSRFSWALPLRNKSGVSVAEAFSSIIKAISPVFVQTYKGSEFLNATFQA